MTFQEFLYNPNITKIDFNDDNEVTLFQVSGEYKEQYQTLRFVKSIDGFVKVYVSDSNIGFFIKASKFSKILKMNDFSLICKCFISCVIKDDDILHAKHDDWLANQISNTASTSSTHPHLSTLERGGSSQHRSTCLGGVGKSNFDDYLPDLTFSNFILVLSLISLVILVGFYHIYKLFQPYLLS